MTDPGHDLRIDHAIRNHSIKVLHAEGQGAVKVVAIEKREKDEEVEGGAGIGALAGLVEAEKKFDWCPFCGHIFNIGDPVSVASCPHHKVALV